MSDQSRNSESHHSKVANKVDPPVDSDPGSQNGPRANSDQHNSQRDDKLAGGTPYMPQAGKPAGNHNSEAEKPGQGIGSDPHNRRRDDKVAGGTPYMPQAGKHAGDSSL
ncbi:hypothetical protein N7486_000671 [Penicillium sp. IBT 16267x]|nr:hypothetical protein N7486_000671 [Penicillium sp. IBT 16267x]